MFAKLDEEDDTTNEAKKNFDLAIDQNKSEQLYSQLECALNMTKRI